MTETQPEASKVGQRSPYSSHTEQVRRSRVLGQLVGLEARTVCLSAPGGYGKTILLGQWSDEDPRRFVHLRGHSQLSDVYLVIAQFFDSLRSIGIAASIRDPRPPGDLLTWHLSVLPAVVEACREVGEPVVVAIDDATAMSDPTWDSFLDCLADNLPPRSTVCVATRATAPGSFRRRRSQPSSLELRADVLALDAMECAELIERLGVRLTDDEFHVFMERTEGWPALVYLAGRAVRDGHVPSALPAASDGAIDDFIRDSILDPLDDEMLDFLLTVSVLDELTGPLCRAVSGFDDSLRRLRELARSNSLIVPVDHTGRRFRMHGLLGDFLSEELQARSQTLWRAAHTAASTAQEAAGDLDSAIHHASASGDDDLLSGHVWTHAPRLIGSGRASILRRWLDDLSSDRIEHNCRLSVVAAWTAQHHGDPSLMDHYRLAAEQASETPGQEEMRPYIDFLSVSLGADGVEASAELAAGCLEQMSNSDPWRAGVCFHRGAALFLLGRAQEALEEMERGRALAHAFEYPLVEALTLATMFLAQHRREDRLHAHSTFGELCALADHIDAGDDAAPVAAPIFTALAFGHQLVGASSDARHAANTALRLTSRLGRIAPWHAVSGRLLLAKVFLAFGEASRATALLAEADDLTGPQSACPLNDELRTEVRRALAVADDPATQAGELTMAEIRVLQYLPTHLTFPDIADELYVSRYTVKTQALAVYRKLGVHSRSDAVERARLLGLLPAK